MKTRLYLDTRASGAGLAPLKLGISRAGQTAFLPLGISLLPSQWDAHARRLKQLPASQFPQRKQIETYINSRVLQIESMLMQYEQSGELHLLSAYEIRDKVQRAISPQQAECVCTLTDTLAHYADSKPNARTRELYVCTLNKVRHLMNDCALDAIDADWIKTFDARMQIDTPSVNARNIHLRNIRAAMNWARDAGLTTQYPFRVYKIKNTETEHRALTLEQMRTFVRCDCPAALREYRDMFLLSFCLIGINLSDLCNLPCDAIQDGRIRYVRNKTHKKFNVKVDNVALELIERLRGTHWLVSVRDRYTEPHNYAKHIDAGLKRIICAEPYNRLTTYWARHTWATLAYNELGASIDLISAALGHQYGSRITSIYINPDVKRVDELNRALIDLIFA